MIEAKDWKIRHARGEDLNFIYSTWLKSYRCDSPTGRSVRKSVFFREYYGVLDSIFQSRSTQTLVACLPNNEIVLLGFLVFQPDILHYIVVKSDWQQRGVAKSLCEKAFGSLPARQILPSAYIGREIQYTHYTRHFEPVLYQRPGMIFNPFLLFQKANQKEAENGKK